MSDRTVLVTGGAGGLGRSVVAALVDDGWRVVVPVETDSDLDAADNVTTVVADLTDPDDVARAIRAADPPLKALVNLVGGFAADQPVETTPLDEFERLFRLNLRPTYLVTQQALPQLKENDGSIVCIGSAAAVNPFAGAAGYAASKAAVIAFAKTVAQEGVRCNAVLPTVIDTPANRAAMPESEHGRLVPPQQIAKVIVWLAGDASAAVNGAAIPV